MPEIDRLLAGTMQMKGSDLHLSSEQTARVRVRGDLKTVSKGVMSSTMLLTILNEILTPDQAEKFATEKELDLTYAVPALGARFRANLFIGRHGPGAVFRVVPSKIPTAQELRIPDAVMRFCNLDRGLVLVTGATGSGKSTTLAAMIDWINENKEEHILTLEDPIEFAHPSKRCLVNQREIGAHSHSFTNALKAALREDPDTILVGEMRDLETIELALTAAETGHLVFGTLHTASAAKTVDRIINVFPGNRQDQIRMMCAESLKGVVAQQLLKSTDGGRVAAMEIMAVNPAISNLIREGKTYQVTSQIQMGRGEGMQTMDQALDALRRAGVIDDETAAAHSTVPLKKQAADAAQPGLAVVR
jgi:twitching motility protein PilT